MIGVLKGHLNYSFASAWHPDGHILAAGNQDKTCRLLWDVRNLSRSLAVLKGRMGAIRGIKFSADGRFMEMAEPADFAHVYDTRAAYGNAQEIDLFGEVAGTSFSPDTEALFGRHSRPHSWEFDRVQEAASAPLHGLLPLMNDGFPLVWRATPLCFWFQIVHRNRAFGIHASNAL